MAHVLIAEARFYSHLNDMLLDGVRSALEAEGHSHDTVTVPGALETPLVLQTMAQSDRYDALIALGAVIRGETYHFEVVSNDGCRAVMEVQLDTGIPVANGILTCEDDDQALARMQQKGTDCAQAAIEMANLLRAIGERPA